MACQVITVASSSAWLRQVNAAVDDVAALAEANARLVAAARGRGHSLTVDDRRHAQTLIRNVAVRLFGIDLNQA